MPDRPEPKRRPSAPRATRMPMWRLELSVVCRGKSPDLSVVGRTAKWMISRRFRRKRLPMPFERQVTNVPQRQSIPDCARSFIVAPHAAVHVRKKSRCASLSGLLEPEPEGLLCDLGERRTSLLPALANASHMGTAVECHRVRIEIDDLRDRNPVCTASISRV